MSLQCLTLIYTPCVPWGDVLCSSNKSPYYIPEQGTLRFIVHILLPTRQCTGALYIMLLSALTLNRHRQCVMARSGETLLKRCYELVLYYSTTLVFEFSLIPARQKVTLKCSVVFGSESEKNPKLLLRSRSGIFLESWCGTGSVTGSGSRSVINYSFQTMFCNF